MARRDSELAALPAGRVAVSQRQLVHLQDRLWILQCAVDDARLWMDGGGDEPLSPEAVRQLLSLLLDAAGDVKQLWIEPAS